MKKIVLSITVALFCIVSVAQKVDLDKVRFEYGYRNTPKFVLDKTFKTYSVSINSNEFGNGMSEDEAYNTINIEGRLKVNEPGHIQIRMSFGDFFIDKSEVKENVIINKSKEGLEISRVYEYWNEITYSFITTVEAKDYTGKLIDNYFLGNGAKKARVYKSAKFSNQNDAYNYYWNNKYQIRNKIVTEELRAFIKESNNSLNNTLGYVATRDGVSVLKMDSKKHLENDAFTSNAEALKAALSQITADVIPAGTKEAIAASINYYKSIPEKYTDPEDKQAKKIRYGAYYNLMVTYFILEEYDTAKEFGNKIIANLYEESDGERQIKEIDKIIAEQTKHGLTTRHYVRDLSDAVAPK